MTQQYLRNCSLVVAGASGNGIELGALRVVFSVRRGDIQTPNTCDATVYNLTDDTANQIASKKPEFTQLILQVSYGSAPLATVFRGDIKQVRKGRLDQKNSYVAITAADGDAAYNYAIAAFTMAAGTAPGTTVPFLIKTMLNAAQTQNGQKVTQGPIPKLSTNKSIRGEVFYGSCKDELREYAAGIDCKWSVQDGAVTLIPNTGYIPEPPVLVTPFTGLIGVPEQTQNGLFVRMLMNPSIKIGRTIKLVSTINQLPLGMDLQSVAQNQLALTAQLKTNADGLYYAMRAEHHGDTRGTDWYTDLTCLAVDASIPANADSVFTVVTPSKAIPRY